MPTWYSIPKYDHYRSYVPNNLYVWGKSFSSPHIPQCYSWKWKYLRRTLIFSLSTTPTKTKLFGRILETPCSRVIEQHWAHFLIHHNLCSYKLGCIWWNSLKEGEGIVLSRNFLVFIPAWCFIMKYFPKSCTNIWGCCWNTDFYRELFISSNRFFHLRQTTLHISYTTVIFPESP